MNLATQSLSPELLVEIVDRYGARPDITPGGPWRFPLHQCIATALPERKNGGHEEIKIEIIDLGLRGLGFKTNATVEEGDLLTIFLKVPDVPPHNWSCRIVDGHSLYGYWYQAGVRFEKAGSSHDA